MSTEEKPTDPSAPGMSAATPYPPADAPPPYSAPAGAPNMGAPYPPGPGFNPAVYPPAPGAPYAMPPQGPNGPPPQMTAVPPGSQTITVTTQRTPNSTMMVSLVDQCPNCKMGSLQEQFTPAGICCAILLFPFGVICCLMSRHKVCPVCGTVYFGR